MKTTLITLFMVLGLATVGFGAGADAELKAIEQQWLDAYMKSDPSFIKNLEADDYSIIEPDGAVWVVFRKGRRDFNENDVLRGGLAAGLVDVKVVRFSDTHTASKFVIRKAERSPAR